MQTFQRGDAIKIAAGVIIEGNESITSATISIFDPTGTLIVAEDNAVVVENSYSYIFQSNVDDARGVYKVIATVSAGEVRSVAPARFRLE